MRRLSAISVACLIGSLAAGAQAPRAQGPADLILINGAVLTVDRTDSVAQAVAITGGTITAVGTTGRIKALAGSATEVIDLGGRAVTPGLIDGHVHFSEADALFTVDLGDAAVTSIADVKTRVAEHVARLKPGEWVRGRGWDEGKYAERRYITAADLDAIAPNNPVWLTHTTGHYGVANSYAMKMAEVRKDTKDPPAGTIDRDAQGAPTGVMKEAAMSLVGRLVPPLTREQLKQGLIRIIQDFNREGMTGAKDPGIGQAKWELYQELLREGRLTVRVFALWSGARRLEDRAAVLARVAANPRQAGLDAGGLLVSGGVKMFMDGSGGARTAWMYDDWNRNLTGTDAGNAGYPATPPDVYRQIVTELHDAGVHVSTHAIGDRAIDWVIDSYDRMLQARPTRGLRHGLIHANTPTDRAIDTMARLQRDHDAGYPESSATFMWWIGDNYAGNLGPARNQRLKPLHTYLRKGVQWSGGSDYPVTPFAARYGLWASVARATLNGTYGATPFGTQEAVNVKTALRSYTAWAARSMFLDDRVGSIEVGKDADLAVWDRNPYEVPAAQLKDLRCELTLVRGRVVYRAAPAPAPAIESKADDWPEWRGRGRLGLWNETGVMDTFPAGGLPVRWRTPIHAGYAGPSVAGGRVFVTDSRRIRANRAMERALALDEATGTILWTHEWEADYTGLQLIYAIGPRATPTVDGDRVYVLGAMGRLTALDTATGRVIWQKDFVRDFGAQVPSWGMASAPLVDGDRLIAIVGGEPGAKVMAFNKRTGEEIWRALSSDWEPGYNQPTIIEAAGVRQLIIWHPRAISALDPASGRVYWEVPSEVDMGMTVATPVRSGPFLLVTSFYNGARMLRLDLTRPAATLLWSGRSNSEVDTDAIHSTISTPVIDGEYIYGIDSHGELRCLELATGRRVWESMALTKERARWATAFLVKNGDRYFINNDRGELVIARLSPAGFDEISRTQLIEPTHPYARRRELGAVHWSHPAYANRHVFVRNDRELLKASLEKDGRTGGDRDGAVRR